MRRDNMTISDDEWTQKAEQGLMELIEGATVTKEQMDKDGCVHTLEAKLPPNIDAVKFALKNRSKGKWADKTETTITQVNVNLNASYNEVKELMEKERQRLIAEQNNAIDVDYIEVNNAENAAE